MLCIRGTGDGYIMVVVEKDAWGGDEHGNDWYEYGMTWRLRGVFFFFFATQRDGLDTPWTDWDGLVALYLLWSWSFACFIPLAW